MGINDRKYMGTLVVQDSVGNPIAGFHVTRKAVMTEEEKEKEKAWIFAETDRRCGRFDTTPYSKSKYDRSKYE